MLLPSSVFLLFVPWSCFVSGNHMGHYSSGHVSSSYGRGSTTLISNNGAPGRSSYSPFNPRFSVERNEISDDEWEEELRSSFYESGLIPSPLATAPPFLINVNFGDHECVHMGTELRAEDTAYPPTGLSFPAKNTSAKAPGTTPLHTLLLFDVDGGNWLHWMVANIPGNDIDRGSPITDYIGPTPADNVSHRYVLLALRQSGWIQPEVLITYYGGSLCDNRNRGGFDLDGFKGAFRLSEIIAANYFRVRYDPFIDSIIQYCMG